MSNCTLIPKQIIQTYPAQAPTVQACEFLEDWKPCSDCGQGYNAGDGVSVCINGTTYIAKSLVDGNTDEPRVGSTQVPPTWELNTLVGWLFK